MRLDNQRKAWDLRYGKGRPIIQSEFKDHRFVAVGSELHFAPANRWRTFIDFLFSYIATVLGSDWGNNELAKPYDERHPLLQWHTDRVQYEKTLQRDEDGFFNCNKTGPLAASLNVAYDLYTIRHNATLQKELVKRLKLKDLFQGAKYELLAAATCIRAGFHIDFEDETDKQQQHPEFIGIHKDVGQAVSVEAKSRHRPGILGFPGTPKEHSHAGVRRILRQALQKQTEHPYIVFIDLNLPPTLAKKFSDAPWFPEVARTVSNLEGEPGMDTSPFNLVIITNHPYHYVAWNESDPPAMVFARPAESPEIPARNPETLMQIVNAAYQYGDIPIEFPEDFNDCQ